MFVNINVAKMGKQTKDRYGFPRQSDLSPILETLLQMLLKILFRSGTKNSEKYVTYSNDDGI